MIEKEINFEILISNLKRYLPADEGKAGAHLQQEALDVIHEGLLDLAFAARISSAQEIDEIGVLENLSCQIGFCGWQCVAEVADGLTLTLVDTALNLQHHDIVRPAMFHRLPRVPE